MSARLRIWLPLVALVLLSAGCAALQGREPIDVILVGLEPLQGEGLEARMLVKLRIQNPNDVPLEFNGVSLQIDVNDKRFATGVSDSAGSVPRFGETVVEVPVSVSVVRIARQALDALTEQYRGKLPYEITGKLAGPAFGSAHFRSRGEFKLPAALFSGTK